ncbi:glutathione S-transferase family protein [Sphingomonas canadensis]|uniref:Glutathione S-transferase family protein n=1 Tax=Sphingomonas canadensis TaxID=1219257 RepID=A0ABW3H6P8_9SPHN|nr:glutathione S-transferase [Sphingomonas canadensis]MCW3836896.1 glutathione S-transferase [Sphingomonas canadensis]
MITVHHLENSRSQRVLWLLEELGLPYEVVHYKRNRKTMLAPSELRRVHPLGKSPVITDGAETIAETGAIIEYLVDKADGRLGAPLNREDRLRYRHFLHYAEGSMMPPLLLKLVLSRVPLFGKSAQKRIQPMIDVHLDFAEAELAARPWFAGDAFTAADVMMSFPLEAAVVRADAARGRPHIAAWLKTIHARPAWQAALAKGGAYAYA